MTISVVSFGRSRLDAASELLAARHRADRARHPLLPGQYEDPSACRAVIEAAMGYAQGVAAVEGGELAGFMFALLNLRPESSASARYGPSRQAMLFAHGHAVAEGADPAVVYRALFAPIAERAAERGVFVHSAHVPAGDRALEDAWANLGFGRAAAVGARDLGPVAGAPADGVQVRQATSEDLEVVDYLVDEESRFHARSPMLRPYARSDTEAAVRESLAQALADEGQAIFLGRVDGEDVGVISIEGGVGSPLFIPERGAYIGDTAVLPQARGRGVGATLLDAALRWARERGYEATTLHFATANPLSGRFWMGHGFEPVMWHMQRHVDERIAWARPPEAAGSSS